MRIVVVNNVYGSWVGDQTEDYFVECIDERASKAAAKALGSHPVNEEDVIDLTWIFEDYNWYSNSAFGEVEDTIYFEKKCGGWITFKIDDNENIFLTFSDSDEMVDLTDLRKKLPIDWEKINEKYWDDVEEDKMICRKLKRTSKYETHE